MPQTKKLCLLEAVGDLFSLAPNDVALAHCVGADLSMSAGIAVSFKNRFGNVQYLLDQGKVPGEVAVLPKELSGRGAPVYYLVSKQYSRAKVVCWTDFVNCVKELRRCCEENEVHRLFLPQIGCGLDGLHWDAVRKLLFETFNESTTTLVVMKLPNIRFSNVSVLNGEPSFKRHQLLGDSNMVRFAANCGSYTQQPKVMHPKQLGLCVSGQTVMGLILQLEMTVNISPCVICMIGTNDLLNFRGELQYKRQFKSTMRGLYFQLKKVLKHRCQRIVFVTLPPIPAHPELSQAVNDLNSQIIKLSAADDNISVVDLYSKLLLPNGRGDWNYFEQWMGPENRRRQDGIHLNGFGHQILSQCLSVVINGV